jgi:hypothetical protein
VASEITSERLHWAIRFGSWGLGALALLTGLTLILQDHSRMGSPGWQTAFAVGLGPTFWGAILAWAGAAMLISILFGDRGDTALGCWAILISTVIFLRAVASFIALMHHPAASCAAAPFFLAMSFVYLTYGLIHLPAFTDRIAQTVRQVGRR